MNFIVNQFTQGFDLNKLLILMAMCFLASVIDAISGGGGLISLPAYFTVGLNPYVALGTNKLSSSISTIASVFRFWKSGKVNMEIIKNLCLFSFVGALMGVRTAIYIGSAYFKMISFFMLILVFLYTLKNKKIGQENSYEGLNSKNLMQGRIMALFIGFYDGFLGPGTGSFLIFALIKIFKLDFTFASGNTKFLNFSSNVTTLISYLILGKINFAYGLPVALVMICGATVGSKLAILKGNSFIKPVFLTVTVVLILKMGKEIFL
ncbi:MAG: TSUP family transporter [Fusobacterium sp.]|nr:TSUP family transporter [Fusobacterium sp.]